MTRPCIALRVAAGWAVLAAPAALAACGSGGAPPAEFIVEAAWARPTPATATRGVVYFTVVSDVDDVLVGVRVPVEVASSASLHETTGSGAQGHHGSGDDDIGMQTLAELPLRAGRRVMFEPGGRHVMLTELAAPLHPGDRFALTLVLASGRAPTIEVIVGDGPP